MANAGPNTNGSQFFLVFGDSQLPPAYTPFGTITAGMSILIHVASGGISNPGPGRHRPSDDPGPDQVGHGQRELSGRRTLM